MDLGDKINLNYIRMTPEEARLFEYKIKNLPLRARSSSGDLIELDVEVESIPGYKGSRYNVGFNLETGVNYSGVEEINGKDYLVIIARDKDSSFARLGIRENSSGDIFNFVI